jgi:outer membrane assembly lipoprotein YfiO
MSRARIIGVLVGIVWLSGAGAPPAQAAWVWSPQTGWIGPGGAVKDSPQEQIAFALSVFEQRDYKRAEREFKKLLKAYPEAREAAEAQYYVGRCREERGDYYAAFLAYRKTIQVYPSTPRLEEILERAFQIGNYFLSGKKRKLFGTAALLPARDKAVEIFQAIVEDGPFSEHGQLAQYKLGLAHLALGDYEPAVSAFEQLMVRYPESPLVDDARFQIAQASLKGTFKPGYDQSPTNVAIQELEAFLREHPDSELAEDATTRLVQLREQRAQHEYQVARFYERRGRPEAARVYYESVIAQFHQTAWASQAAARVQVLERQR